MYPESDTWQQGEPIFGDPPLPPSRARALPVGGLMIRRVVCSGGSLSPFLLEELAEGGPGIFTAAVRAQPPDSDTVLAVCRSHRFVGESMGPPLVASLTPKVLVESGT